MPPHTDHQIVVREHQDQASQTVFNMFIFSRGNTKEYLVHAVAVLRLINQKGLNVQVVAKYCLSIFVLHVFHKWSAPQLCLLTTPALEGDSLHNCDFCVVCVVNGAFPK